MEYAYQWTPEHLASYPLFYDDPNMRARDFVLVSCANATADGGRCNNGIEGGKFWGSASVTLSIPLVVGVNTSGIKNVTVMYTLDRTTPSADHGMVYTAPIVLKQSTTIFAIKLVGHVDGSATTGTQMRRAVFEKQ
jgi:hypothetical protein